MALDWLKKSIQEIISVEGTSRLGRYNMKWAGYTFIVWIFIMLVGTKISYTPKNGWNPLKGFVFELDSATPTLLTIVVILTPLVCTVGLLILYKKGYIEKDDF